MGGPMARVMPPPHPMAIRWRELTRRQRQAVNAVGRLTAERGFAPTIREIAKDLGVSLPRAQQLVAVCVRKGRLLQEPRTPRSIRVIPQP